VLPAAGTARILHLDPGSRECKIVYARVSASGEVLASGNPNYRCCGSGYPDTGILQKISEVSREPLCATTRSETAVI